jgi:hypothetical protein
MRAMRVAIRSNAVFLLALYFLDEKTAITIKKIELLWARIASAPESVESVIFPLDRERMNASKNGSAIYWRSTLFERRTNVGVNIMRGRKAMLSLKRRRMKAIRRITEKSRTISLIFKFEKGNIPSVSIILHDKDSRR